VAAAEQHQHSTAPDRSLSTAGAREIARAALDALLADRARRRRGWTHAGAGSDTAITESKSRELRGCR
jgi:hypothetical protein